MKRLNKKKNSFVFCIALIILMMCTMASFLCEYVFCATIYQNDIKDDTIDKKIGENKNETYDISKRTPTAEDVTKKPTVESTIDPNILYTTKKDWEKEKKNMHNIIIQKETATPPEATQEYKKDQKYTYIRHRNSIATISGEYLWEDYIDDDKISHTKLYIYPSDDEKGFPHYAYSGFYQIGDDIYCFDKNGHLIKGIAKDEYDIIYEFDNDTGKFIKKYKE